MCPHAYVKESLDRIVWYQYCSIMKYRAAWPFLDDERDAKITDVFASQKESQAEWNHQYARMLLGDEFAWDNYTGFIP